MKQKIGEKIANAVLSLSARYAVKKANTLCRGRMYEPIVPTKLTLKQNMKGATL